MTALLARWLRMVMMCLLGLLAMATGATVAADVAVAGKAKQSLQSEEPGTKSAVTDTVGAAGKKLLTVGMIGIRDQPFMQSRWQSLVKHLDVLMPDYRFDIKFFTEDELLAAAARNQLDFAVVGGAQFIRLREAAGSAIALATLTESLNGRESNVTGGTVVVTKDSPINRLTELRGLTVAMTSVGQTSGYVAPYLLLLDMGIAPGDVRQLVTGNPLEKVVDALRTGQADGAFLGSGMLEYLGERGVVAPGELRVLEERNLPGFPYAVSTSLLPGPAFVALPRVTAQQARQMMRALLLYEHQDQDTRLLIRFGVAANYEPVADALRRLRMAPFDQSAPVGWAVLWHQHRIEILLLLLLVAAVLALAWRQLQRNRLLAKVLAEEQALHQALALEQQHLQTLLDTMPNLVWLKDSHGRYLRVNRRFEALFGRPQAKIIGHTDEELLGIAAAKVYHDQDYQVLSAGQHLVIEETLNFADGHHEQAEIVKVPLRDEAGRAVGVLGIAHDITERNKQQQALHELNQRFQSILTAVPDLMFEFDAQGVYRSVWARDTQLLAEQRERLLGMSVNDVLPLPAARVVRAALDEAARNGFSRGKRIVLQLADGKHWFELSTARADDNHERFIMLSRDISDRLRLEDDLHSIMLYAGDGIWMLDAQGDFLYANPAAASITGYSLDEIKQLNLRDISDDEQASAYELVREHRSADEAAEFSEWQLRHKDGHLLPIEAMSRRLPDGRFLAIGRDISQRKAQEAVLLRAAGVFAASIDGIMITDPHAVIQDVNPAFTAITGYPRDEVIGKSASLLSSGRHAKEFFDTMWRVLSEQGSWRGEIWNRRKTGEVFAELLSIASVLDDQGQPKEFISVFSDISRIKQHEEELDRIAHYDVLTSLPNRRLLDDRLRQARARADRDHTRMALCFLDLDSFKPVNDRLGHSAGDELLITLSHRLERSLRGGETIARIGGDEFVILLTDLMSPDECLPALQRMLELIAEPVMVHGHEISVSGSIGVTVYPDDESDIDALMRHADQAMYAAKELGKNRVHLFDSENDKRQVAHREALAELQNAFNQREFVLWYQPKIDLRSGEVVGAEALIRWQKPDGRIVAPMDFLPMIESTALELQISAWVIETALADTMRLRAHKLPMQISANLVAAHLSQPDFVDWLSLLLQCYEQLPRGAFSLEILESAAIGDVDSIATRLNSVRQLGVELALDDFGTGYSSLAYFRRLPINTLKIDQGFVRDMLNDEDDRNIVESVVRLAGAFHRQVIAEGVETVDHWRALLAMGCDHGQGYGIARPMPFVQFESWVRDWQQRGAWKEVVGDTELGD